MRKIFFSVGMGLILFSGVPSAHAAVGGWGAFFPYTSDPLSNVLAIAAGQNVNGFGFGMALKADSSVVEFDYEGKRLTTQPANLTNITRISAGYNDYRMALRANGMVVMWGSSALPANLNYYTNLASVGEISVGGAHAMALKTNGLVVAWGSNTYGQTNVPSGLSNITAIAAGYNHCLALRNNGSVVGWGANYYSQSDLPADLTDARAISAGVTHSIALKSNGTVVVWGANYKGDSTFPPEAYALTNEPPGLSNVIAVSAGMYFNLALKADGTVVGWGRDVSGEATGGRQQSGVQFIAAGKSFNYPYTMALGSGPFLRQVYDTNNPTNASPFSLKEGATFSLSARVFSDSAVFHQWLFNGQPMTGFDRNPLVISNLQYAHSGNYSLLVSNAIGSTARLQTPVKCWVFAGNDNFTQSKTVASTGGRMADYLNGKMLTRETDEPLHAGAPSGNSIWFTWIAPATDTVWVDTEGSTFDTVLAVYTGDSLANLQWVASDDDSGSPVPPLPNVSSPGRRSKLQFGAVKGVPYRIVVASYELTLPVNEVTVQLNLSLASPILSASLTASQLAVTTYAQPGAKVVLEGSNDLKSWTPVATNSTSAEGISQTFIPISGNQLRLFFRSVKY